MSRGHKLENPIFYYSLLSIQNLVYYAGLFTHSLVWFTVHKLVPNIKKKKLKKHGHIKTNIHI